MTNTKKYTIAGVLLFFAGTASAIAINRNTKKKELRTMDDYFGGKTTETGVVLVNQTKINTLPEGNFPLKRGDKNKKVAALQTAINRKYGTSIDIDGLFGQGTFDILCDKFWNICHITTTSYPFYKGREVTSADFNEINS